MPSTKPVSLFYPCTDQEDWFSHRDPGISKSIWLNREGQPEEKGREVVGCDNIMLYSMICYYYYAYHHLMR